MPTLMGIFAYGKTWTKMGPFDMGPTLFKAIGAVSVLGVLLIIYAGIQPPNDKALPVTAVTIVVLLAAWHLGMKKLFAGPPLLAEIRGAKPEAAPVDDSGLDIEPA
jgi:hypothetical protein